ncbi:MAG TPA: hypothetical protein VJW76_00580, partial [Verrucomicrobiae bacterium]|nr:hypothetical protein [Verrucomicrobiae bacterium]
TQMPDGTKRVVDFANLDSMIGSIDITRALVGTTNLFQDTTNRGSIFWLTNRVAGFPAGATAGITNQIFVSTRDVLSDAEWSSLSLNPVTGQQKEKAIDGFRQFLNMPALFNVTNPASPGPIVQAPFTPTRKLDLQMSWQVNDPLVHYHLEDLYDPFRSSTNNVRVLRAVDTAEPSNLGVINHGRFRPWGGGPVKEISNDELAYNPGVKDPLIRKSDDWDFPTNKFANIGWLGRVHRGSPWQTVYLKPYVATVDQVQWNKWAGRPDTHPTNDWVIVDQFTTAVNDNAARGLLSVNQTNLAAWSAVLSGVVALSNSLAFVQDPNTAPVYEPVVIQPASAQLYTIVSNINVTRLQQPGQAFPRMGSILASPALTVASPFLNAGAAPENLAINDAAYERIPQQILSLLKEDESYVVIYAFGQSLKPAADSIVTAPGVYRGLCGNYQITGEVATKTMVRFMQTSSQQGRPSTYQAVIESYDVLPTD